MSVGVCILKTKPGYIENIQYSYIKQKDIGIMYRYIKCNMCTINKQIEKSTSKRTFTGV